MTTKISGKRSSRADSPAQVAQVFAEQLGPDGPFGGTFQRVVFAIYDSSSGTPVLNAFQAAFPHPQ